MIALKARNEIVVRGILIVVILFNAFAPIAGRLRTVQAQDPEPAPTETPTAEPTVTPIETPLPVMETAIAEAIPSPTEAVTVTPIPPTAEVATISPLETPTLTLFTDPEVVQPGAEFTLHWTIEGIAVAEHKLVLVISLPKGFSLQGKYEGTFDEVTRTLTMDVTAPSGQILLVATDFTGDVTFEAQLLENEEVLAKASLFLPLKEQFVLDVVGGLVEAKDGEIKVEFPQGVLPEKAVIEIGKPSGDEIPPSPLLGKLFEITASGEDSKQDLTQFSKELSIFVSYADLGIPSEQESQLHLYWYNEDTQEWEALPTMVDKETKTLHAFTDHFTVFDVNINYWHATRLPTVDAFQVSSFTGAGTYSLPIQVPAGPGGFQPNLTLSYNSQVVDQSSLATQASWVGMGWSLETGSIDRDSHGTDSQADDTYLLNVGGVSTRLVLDANNIGYHATDDNFWKITYPTAGNGYTWSVQDKQGNTYYFEKKLDYPYQSAYCETGWVTYSWKLTKVRNIFGKEIVYEYDDTDKKPIMVDSFYYQCQTDPDYLVPTAIYPKDITYADGRYRVEFVLNPINRLDYTSSWDWDRVFHAYERKRLGNIYIKQDLDANGDYETTLRRYEFTYKANTDSDIIFPGYQWSAGGKTNTLASVREYGVGGTTGLPAVTFSYSDGAGENIDNLHLLRAENGYGGVVEFSYDTTPYYYQPHASISHTNLDKFGQQYHPCSQSTQWSPSPWVDAICTQSHLAMGYLAYDPEYNNTRELVRPGGMYKLSTIVASLPNPSTFRLGLRNGTTDNYASYGATEVILQLPSDASQATPLIQTSYAELSTFKFELLTSIYRVTQKRILDGNGHTYTYSYSYTGEAVNDTTTSSGVCGFTVDPYGEVIDTSGCYEFFPKFSEFRGHSQVTETGPDGVQTITQFHQNDILKGRPSEVTSMIASQLLSKAIYTYTSSPLSISSYPACCGPFIGLRRDWTYTSAVENRTYASDGSYSKTNTIYTYESAYGNLTAQTEQSWNGSSWANYRTTSTDYSPNNGSLYLVGLPARQQIKDANGNLLADTLYLYDQNTAYNQPPTAGKLSIIRTWLGGTEYSQTSLGYDNWGNRTSETTYSGAGTWDQAPTTGARTMTTVYDPILHVYPVSQTTPPPQAGGQGLLTTWNYDYDPNIAGDDYILGVPTKETDPNGNQTSAQYDAFGRITRLIRPGDDSNSPTMAVQYFDNNPLPNFFHTEIRQRLDTTRYVTVHRYYDGIGRQTRIENGFTTNGFQGAVNAADIITTKFQYPTFTTVEQSMPFGPGETERYTSTTTDPAAQITTITAPDGTATTSSQDGLVATVSDALGNPTVTTSDVWGRVISVVPPTGPSIAYAYDELNRLVTATRGSRGSLPGAETNPGTTGLTAWWSLDETGGTRSDSHVNALQLTDANTVLSGAGKISTAGDFERDNAENLSRSSSAPTQMGTSDVYFAAWVKPESLTGSQMMIVYHTGAYQLYLTANNKAQFLICNVGCSSYVVSGESAALSAGVWSFVEGWTDKANRKIYINVNNGTPTSTTWAAGSAYDGTGSSPFEIGGRPSDGSHFDGLIDEVVFYKRALTATERAWLYNKGSGRSYADLTPANPGTTNLIAWWTLNQPNGTRTDSHASIPLTDTNTVTTIAGKQGNAARFTAANTEWLSNTANDTALSTGDVNFTFCGWMNLSSKTTYRGLVSKYEHATNNKEYYLGYASDLDRFTFVVSNNGTATGGIAATDFGSPATGAWNYVCAWHDATANTINIQVNNGAVNSLAWSSGVFDSAAPFNIGRIGGGTTSYHDGSTDEVVFYKRVLTAAERTWLYNSGAGRTYGDLTPQPPTPPAPTTTTLSYDNAGRKTGMTDPDMGSWTYKYDALGNLTRQTDARGQRICLYYDALNRLTGKQYRTDDNCPTSNPALNVSYTYDVGANGKGRRTSMTTAIVSNAWTYDARGRVTSETFNAGTAYTTQWTLYNAADLPVTMIYPDGEPVTYGYNNRMLLETVSGTSTYVASTTYDSAGRLSLRTLGTTTPIQTGYYYYPWHVQGGRLQALQTGTSLDPISLQDLWYSYDAAGNIRTIRDTKNSNQKQCFQYDGLHRLTNATTHTDTPQGCTTQVGAGNYAEAYSYDPAGNLDVKAGVDLNYNDTAHVHAVTHIGATQKYWYDQNGNQTTRIVGADTFNLIYDAENRLVEVKKNSVTMATFVYDGDGRRVRSTVSGTTTYFIGAHYEVTGSQVTKYYFAGTQRVAMRKYTIPQSMTVEYFLGDHLGSTSLTTDNTGAKVSEMRYKPWGEVRSWWTAGLATTPAYKLPDYTFTGQFSYMDDPSTTSVTEGFGLMFYQSRFYDPALGRFTSADSIIPEQTQGVQAWDRYAYANNDPLRYTDPTGHATCTDDGYCGSINSTSYWNKVIKDLSSLYGITFSGKWSQKDKLAALTGAIVVAGALARYTGLSSLDSFQAVFGDLTFARSTDDPGYWGQYGEGTITFYAEATQWTTLVAHELGHAFNARIADNGGVTPYTTLAQDGIWTAGGEQFAGIDPNYTVAGTGTTCGNSGTRQCLDGEGNPIPANNYRRTLQGLGFRHGWGDTSGEDFADTFANWATGSFTTDRYGTARSSFMTTNIAEWVASAMGG